MSNRERSSKLKQFVEDSYLAVFKHLNCISLFINVLKIKNIDA